MMSEPRSSNESNSNNSNNNNIIMIIMIIIIIMGRVAIAVDPSGQLQIIGCKLISAKA